MRHKVSYTTEDTANVTNMPADLESVLEETELKLDSKVPERNGYTFKGWTYENKDYDPSDIFSW